MRTIIITEVAENDFTIIEGDSCVQRLCWDEVLPIVAKLLICPEKKVLRKLEEYWEIERRVREEIISQLRPVDRLLLQAAASRKA